MADDAQQVMVVEDEPVVAMDLELMLQQAGYEVLGPVGTLSAALELAAGNSPAGAVLDMNLQGEMSGPVVRLLLAAAVPVVLLTGYGTKALAEPYCGCPIIRKPYDPKDLLTTLEHTMARRQTSAVDREPTAPESRH